MLTGVGGCGKVADPLLVLCVYGFPRLPRGKLGAVY